MSRRRRAWIAGTISSGILRASGGSLRHRRSSAVVLRGVERAEYRFLEWHSAREIVLRSLRAHGARAEERQPATARRRASHCQAAWVSDFLNFTAANHVPVDFVSTHAYADDTVQHLFGTNEDIPDGRSRLPRRCQGARRNQGLLVAQPSLLYDRVERAGNDAGARHNFRRPGSRQHRARSATASSIPCPSGHFPMSLRSRARL